MNLINFDKAGYKKRKSRLTKLEANKYLKNQAENKPETAGSLLSNKSCNCSQTRKKKAIE